MKPIRRRLSTWIIQQNNKARRAATDEDLPIDPDAGEEESGEGGGDPEPDPEP